MTTIAEQKRRSRRKRKQELIELLGGRCTRCEQEYPLEAYDFHHTNPLDKSFGISQETITRYKWDTILTEAAKTILVCANCHRVIHADNEEEYFEDSYCRHRDERTDPDPRQMPLFSDWNDGL